MFGFSKRRKLLIEICFHLVVYIRFQIYIYIFGSNTVHIVTFAKSYTIMLESQFQSSIKR